MSLPAAVLLSTPTFGRRPNKSWIRRNDNGRQCRPSVRQEAGGDLIGSGTVGTGCILELGPEKTDGWLKPGDTMELEIERLGTLTTKIV